MKTALKVFLPALALAVILSGTAAAAPTEAESFLSEGNAAFEAGNYALAGTFFNQAIVAAPDWTEAYLSSARAWLATGDYLQAINDLDECIKLSPGDIEIYCIKSYAWQMLGEFDTALSVLDGIMAERPQNGALYYARGLLYARAGETEKALADYDEALSIHRKTRKKLRQDSLQIFAELTGTHILDKNGGALYFQRGVAYSQDGNFKEARKDFRRARRLKPELTKETPEGI